MSRTKVAKILSVAFAILAVNAWGQVVQAAQGNSSDSPALVALQGAIGLTAALTAWGGWRVALWTWKAAIAYGVVTACMLAALPFLLGLAAEERSGIWTGAAAILVFSLLCARFFHRHARSSRDTLDAQGAQPRSAQENRASRPAP